jgi:hypothetical protein
MKAALICGALAVTLAGCVETYTIRATQLAVFNEEISTNAGVRKTLRLQTADGRLVELNPPALVTITKSDGQQLFLCSPLRAEFEGDAISVHHACGSPARVDRHDIAKVEVEEH